MKYVDVCGLADIAPNTARTVWVDGKSVALCHIEGAVHALDNSCPHAGGALASGKLCGRHLSCPVHGWRFDVTTGALAVAPSIRVAKFPVKLERDRVLVGVEA